MKNYEQMNDFEMSVLSEIGNVGAGNAATALSHILADRVNMSVPDLRILDVSDMTTLLGGPENEFVGILVTMEKDVRVMMLFLLEQRFVCKLIEVLLNEKISSFSELSDMGRSALMEIGNILAGSYVNAIATMTNLNIELSTPQIAIDMVGAILSYPAALFGAMGDKLLLIEEDFISSNETIRSHLLIMPEIESLQAMLESLGVA